MHFNRVKVSTRLTVGFGLVLFLMAVLGAISLLEFNSIGAINQRILEKDWVKMEAAHTIHATTRANARRTLELLVTPDPAELARIRKHIDDNKQLINGALEQLDRLVYAEAGRNLLARIKADRAAYVASFSQVGRLVDQGQREQAIELARTQTLPALDTLQLSIDAFLALQKQLVDASGAEIQERIAAAHLQMLVGGCLALLVGTAAAVLIARGLVSQLGGEPGYAVELTGHIAAGDLSRPIELRSQNPASLLGALRSMRDGLRGIVEEVRQGADSMAAASQQMASGNQDLATRTEEQAVGLEQISASVRELSTTLRRNLDEVEQASRLATEAADVALQGGSVVNQMVDTMDAINRSSHKIIDIISVIDGIAFQTNILALNAAVEAARAGEQGRGFAVVAAEVRKLAQRSATAAKEVKQLIDDSVSQVSTGDRLAREAGTTMEDIIATVRRVTQIMHEVHQASSQQGTGIEQVNVALTQIDGITQQNAALVEESAVAAQSLREQAGQLAHTVGVFKLGPVTDLAVQAPPAPPGGGAPPRQAKAALKHRPASLPAVEYATS